MRWSSTIFISLFESLLGYYFQPSYGVLVLVFVRLDIFSGCRLIRPRPEDKHVVASFVAHLLLKRMIDIRTPAWTEPPYGKCKGSFNT